MLVAILALVSALAPLICPYDPLALSSDSLLGPTPHHLLGTDELGRDLLTRIIYGAREALLVSIGSAIFACVVGVAIGLVAGYLGGWFDGVFMRIIDVLMAMPAMLLALVIVVIAGNGELNMLIAIAIGSVPAFARLARASTLALREQEYVLAARNFGASRFDIMVRTVLPNIRGPIVVQAVVTASVAVVVAAGLSFLGLGTIPPAPSWGGMLNASRTFLYRDPWYGLFPGLALVLTVVAFDCLGRGLQIAIGDMRSIQMRATV